MKEATGEVSMTIVVLVAIGVIGLIVAANWGRIRGTIENMWSNTITNTNGNGAGAPAASNDTF